MFPGVLTRTAWKWRPEVHFGVALATVLAAVLLRIGLQGVLHEKVPYSFQFIAVLISSYLGGLWPGLVAASIGMAVGTVLFLPPSTSGEFATQGYTVTLFSAAGTMMVSCVVCSQLRSYAIRNALMVETLAHERTRTQIALNGISDAFYAIDRNWMVILTNETFEELTRDDFGSIKGRHLLTDVLKDQDHPAKSYLVRAMETKTQTTFNMPGLHGKWYHVRAFPTEDGLFVYIQDHTNEHALEIRKERVLAQERSARSEAEELSRMKDEFIANLSHELRTPLTALKGWTEILERKNIPDEDVVEGLHAIERSSQRLTQMIEELLDLSRINAGKLKLELEFVELGEFVADATDVFMPVAASRGIDLVGTNPENEMWVRADPQRLHQVLSNLLSNAIKFTPRGGQIAVEVFPREGSYCCRIKDNGQGIPSEFLPHLFDRFRQANATIRRQHEGLGLGLSIVKQLVELHGGNVSASSDGPNLGSTFEVTLPQASLPASLASSEISDDFLNPSLEKVDLVLVEDDDGTRQVLMRLLGDQGAEIKGFGSAIDALSYLEQHVPDAIVSDIGMPEMDGYEFMNHVRKIEHLSHTPSIALTAFARDTDRAAAIKAGFNAHMAKPVNAHELGALLSKLLAKTEA